MAQVTDQMAINSFFLEVAGRVNEAQREGATELTIRLPMESAELATGVAALFNRTDFRAMVRGQVMLIIEWANRTYS